MPDAALVDQIRAILSASPFHGGCQQLTGGHRKV